MALGHPRPTASYGLATLRGGGSAEFVRLRWKIRRPLTTFPVVVVKADKCGVPPLSSAVHDRDDFSPCPGIEGLNGVKPEKCRLASTGAKNILSDDLEYHLPRLWATSINVSRDGAFTSCVFFSTKIRKMSYYPDEGDVLSRLKNHQVEVDSLAKPTRVLQTRNAVGTVRSRGGPVFSY